MELGMESPGLCCPVRRLPQGDGPCCLHQVSKAHQLYGVVQGREGSPFAVARPSRLTLLMMPWSAGPKLG